MSTNQYAAGNGAANRPLYFPGIIIKQNPSQTSFRKYLFFENKIFSLLMIFLMVCQFIAFKLLYPYPDFFSDSYSYLFAAYAHLDVNIWPIGYSRFLNSFHLFTHSALALNFFQYMFLGLAGMYLYHTIVYLFPTGSKTRTFLCLALFFNPLNLYLANYVSSDAIFIGLSLIWLCQIIWIIYRPHRTQIIIVSICFFVAFTFRYNAMFYPIITAISFLISKHKAWMKAAGILLGPALAIPFILFSLDASKELTGKAQFPPVLGGWQWGNNALYMRGFIQEDSNKFPTPETAELDKIARKYFSQPSRPQNQLSSYVANFFIRQPEAPLKQYMLSHYSIENDTAQVMAWGKASNVFRDYGLFLIKRHPLAFFRYYLLVNTKNYFLPPLEKLEVYNLGLNKISPIAAYWFDFGSVDVKVNVISKSFQGLVLMAVPVLFFSLNIYYFLVLVQFIMRNRYKNAARPFLYSMGLVCLFLLLNAAFSIFANIIVIRYEVFPMYVFLAFAMLLTDYLEMNPRYEQSQNITGEVSENAGSYKSAAVLNPNI